MKLKTVSATSVKMYDTCPLQWKYKYKVKFLQMENPAFLIGSAFHKGAELFHQGMFRDAISDRLKTDLLSGEQTTPEQLDRYSLAMQMVDAYMRNPVTYPTIHTEYKFNIPIFGLTAPLYGFVDRIVEGGIVEYKTSAKDYTIDDIDNIQTDIYSYVYRHLYQSMPKVTYCVLNKSKSKRTDYKPQILEITREEANMAQLEKRLRIFEQNINAEIFEPKAGIHCRWCFANESCKYAKYGN